MAYKLNVLKYLQDIRYKILLNELHIFHAFIDVYRIRVQSCEHQIDSINRFL